MPDILNSDGTVEKALFEYAQNTQESLKITPSSHAELAQCAKKVKKLFADKKVGELYKADRINSLEEKVFMLAVKDPANFDRRLSNLEEIFDERRSTLRSLNNVSRQKYEIRKYELSPGEMNVGDFVSQVESRIPLEEHGRWMARNNRYGSDNNTIFGFGILGAAAGLENAQGLNFVADYGDGVGNNSTSWRGGSEEQILAVQNRDTPIIHTRMPPKDYRNIVFDTEVRTLDEIKVNSARLQNFLETGVGDPLTESQKKKLGVRDPIKHVISNVVEKVGDLVHQTVNWAGKGIIHKSKAADDNRHRNYLQKRSALLAQMAWSMGSSSRDGGAHTRVLKAINDTLEGSDDIMDQAVFAKMQTIIADEIKNESTATKEEMDDFNKKIQELNKKMLNGLQDKVNTEDEMWKYRVLQVFLLVTPLGAFSVAGQLFNYLDPLMELIGPIFDAHTSLSEGIASMTTSDVLGPFGKIAKFARLDQGIEIVLDKTPIVSDLLDVVDYALDSNIFQSGMAELAPLSGAPLVFVGIAAVNSFFRFDTELAHHKKTREFINEQEKTLDEEIKRFQKERETGREKDDDRGISEADALKPKNLGFTKRIAAFAEKRFAGLQEANLDAETARYVAEAAQVDHNIFEEIFAGLGLKVKEKDKDGKDVDVVRSMTDLLKSEKLESSFDVIKLLEASDADTRKNLVGRVMFLEGLESNKKDEDLVQHVKDNFYRIVEKFGKLPMKDENGTTKNLSDRVDDRELSEESLLKMLTIPDNARFKTAISRDCVLMMREYGSKSPSEQEDLREKQGKKVNREFVFKSADALGIRKRERDNNGDLMNEEKKCQYLEAALKAEDTKYLLELAQQRIPSNSPSKPNLSPLNGQTPFYNVGTATTV